MADHSRPYGVGLAYRPETQRELFRCRQVLDMLEIAAIDYTVRNWRILQDPRERLIQQALDAFPSALHATTLSIGSVEHFDEGDVERTLAFMDKYGLVSFSEHLAFHRLDDFDLHSFLPMPFDEISLDWLVRKYHALRSRTARPIALENVSYLVHIPGSEMDEATFLTELTRRTDCMLLLDVTNVFNNAHNHQYDPMDFIRRLPGERIEHLHIAGGYYEDGAWMDSHSKPVMNDVWGLLDEALKCTAAETVILEKDVDYMPFADVEKDLRTSREIFYRNRPERPPQGPPPSERVPRMTGDAPPVDPDDPRFAELRNFQRALIRMIRDKAYRAQALADPDIVQKTYPMGPKWLERLIGCGRRHYDMLLKKCLSSQQREVQTNAEVRRREWQAWAGA